MDRQEILDVIRRTALANGGVALGHDRLADIGIPPAVWGRHWPRLSAAQREAGVMPNKANEARPEENALARLVTLARELGAVPTSRERVVKHNQDPTFPSESVWARLGPKTRLISRLVQYAEAKPGHEDVLALCAAQPSVEGASPRVPAVAFGSVYMLRARAPGTRSAAPMPSGVGEGNWPFSCLSKRARSTSSKQMTPPALKPTGISASRPSESTASGLSLSRQTLRPSKGGDASSRAAQQRDEADEVCIVYGRSSPRSLSRCSAELKTIRSDN